MPTNYPFKFSFTILLCFILLSCDSNNHKNDICKNNLKGRVRSLRETSYAAIDRFGEISKGAIARRMFFENNYYQLFNHDGFLISEIEYENNGDIESRSTFMYDIHDRLIEEVWYNENGNIDMKWLSKFDKSGNIIESIGYDSIGALNSKYIYTYDKNGNKISECNYDSNGDLDSKSYYKYDNEGNELEDIQYDSKGNIDYKINRRFDKRGNESERVYKRYFLGDEYFSKSLKKYDNRDNIIEDTDYKSDGSIEEKLGYVYSYDKKGNWISRVCYIDEKPKFIIEREIEYYPFLSLFAKKDTFFVKKRETKLEPSTDEILEITANNINKTCPLNVDKNTRLDNAIAKTNNYLQYNYTLITIDKEDLSDDYISRYMEPVIINSVKTSPDLKFLRDLGTTLIYNYRDKNGVFIYSFSVTPDMYR